MAWTTDLVLAIAQTTQPPAASLTQPRWQLDTAPSRCTLTRQLTPGQGLALATMPGTDRYALTMIGDDLHARSNGAREDVQLSWRTDVAPARWPATFVRGAGPIRAIRLEGLRRDSLAAFAGADTLVIRWRTGVVGPLSILNASKAAEALRNCVAAQLIDWGADPAQFQAGGTPAAARSDPDGWLAPGQVLNIPTRASQLDIAMRLGIAPDGSVDACRQETGEAEPAVAAFVCKALQGRALYAPALAPDGKPVRGVGVLRVQRLSVPG